NYQKGYFWNDTTSTWKDSYLDSVFYDSHGNMLRNSIYFSGSSGWLRTYQLDYNNTYTPEGWLKKSDVVYTDFDNSDYSSFNFTEVLAFGPNGEPLLSKYVQGLVNSGSPDSTENRVYSFHNFSPGAAEQTDSVVTLNYADGAWVPVLSWATTYREYDSYKTRHYVIVNNAAIPVYTEDQQFSGTGFGIGYEVDSVMTDGSVKLIWKRVGNLVVKPNGFVTQATFVEVNGTNPTDSIYVARYRYFGEHSVTGNAIKQNAKMGAFPNPFQNYLQLRFPSGILADAYTVSDFSGRILMHGQLHVNNGIAQISASDLNVGVYLLGLISKGQLLQTIKICKTPQ
ncbi:MAG: T9SS type A sorting domain-containing protein, partial [Bacteroidota bacterium]